MEILQHERVKNVIRQGIEIDNFAKCNELYIAEACVKAI